MASGKSIDNLSDELLLEIFSNFTTEQLAMTVQHVCCRWKEVSQDNSLWKNREYSPGETTDDEIVQHLRNMPMLIKFSPKRGIRTKEIIDTICNTCRNIQQLEFTWNQKIKLHTLKQILHAFPDLIQLYIPLPTYADPYKYFKIIGQFRKLNKIGFTGGHIGTNEKPLSILADECPSLQHIDLGYSKFCDQDIRYFLEKKRCKMLSFSVRTYISTLTYLALSKCTNLEYLVYDNFNEDLPDSYILLFSKLSKMKNLSISYCKEGQTRNLPYMLAENSLPFLISLSICWCDKLDAHILNTILRNCPGIRDLEINDCYQLCGGFESISSCSNLEQLKLKCPLIEDKSFKYIGNGCHELKCLIVESCFLLTDKAFEYICAGCPRLGHLSIIDSHEITDGIFKHLFKCRYLIFLGITHNQNITGIYFNDIPTYLTNLKKLLIWCQKLNKENIEKLQTKMPHLELQYDTTNDENEQSYSDIDLEDTLLFN